MNIENKVAVVTDTGSSIRPESPLVKEFDVVSVPLDIKFYENGEWVAYEDTDFPIDELYSKIRNATKLPQTSGAITDRVRSHYENFAQQNRPVISIHITAHHSVAWESAVLGAKIALEKYPHLLIEVVNSKQVSIGTWFLVEQAATLANEGYPLEDITKITLETIPKIETVTSLSTFDNIVKSGRLPKGAGFVGNQLHLKPIVGIVDGEIKLQGMARTQRNVTNEFVKRIENAKGEVAKLAIIHANFNEGALLLKDTLQTIYPKNIRIFEAGPVLGVNTGEKGLGIVIQRI
jgi:DegV family protein with EDD domain